MAVFFFTCPTFKCCLETGKTLAKRNYSALPEESKNISSKKLKEYLEKDRGYPGMYVFHFCNQLGG